METVILILAHNEAKHIEKTIQSIANQNVKVVFVDDASTDDTLTLALQAFNKYGIKYQLVKNHNNLGVVESANRAFDLISNKNGFVMRLDGDDELLVGAIKKLQESYKPGSFVVGSYIEKHRDKLLSYIKPQTVYEALACGVLMRIEDINKVGKFANDDVGVFVEYDLYARLENIKLKPIIISDPVYLYNRSNDSITSNIDLINDSVNKLTMIWGPSITSQIRKY